MVESKLVKIIQTYLLACQSHGLDVRFGVVFGSFARGDTREWSDIDLLIVSPQFDGDRNRADTRLLWRVAAYIDNRIEPIPCGLIQWEQDDASAIIEIARKEGKRIELPLAQSVISPTPGAE